MTVHTSLGSSLATVGLILAAMALVALVETLVPLHARGRWYKAHVGPNLALTFITFATNVVFNAALVTALFALQAAHAGLLYHLPIPRLATAVLGIAALDFAFYVAHRAMHASPSLWRFHAVHHSDPAVDVTTTIRQHPVESVIRYVFMAAFAIPLGVAPGPFAVYRVWSALHGLLDHANVRMPQRLDTLLSLVVSTPNMHKVHHSRAARETNSNYGPMLSLFDRVFMTFTPSVRGPRVVYGLDGFDDEPRQSTGGLLALPFRSAAASASEPIAPIAARHIRSTAR